MMINWELQGDLVEVSPGNSSKSISHGDFSLEPLNDDHLKLIMVLVHCSECDT